MSSASLLAWTTLRAAKLDEIEAAHAAVGGLSRGRRRATEQINHAYVVLLCSQFQGFCRDLHSECVDFVVQSAVAEPMQRAVGAEFWRDRRLDRGNPTSEGIGSDFSRLGIDFWASVALVDRRAVLRRMRLDGLVRWRNAIAHQDFGSRVLAPLAVDLGTVRAWRRCCGALARSFDRAMARYLGEVLGTNPWERED